MIHRDLRGMLDEMLNDPDELFIRSNSRHCALIVLRDESTLLLQGDFSGTPEENEATARRLLESNPRRPRAVRRPRHL